MPGLGHFPYSTRKVRLTLAVSISHPNDVPRLKTTPAKKYDEDIGLRVSLPFGSVVVHGRELVEAFSCFISPFAG